MQEINKFCKKIKNKNLIDILERFSRLKGWTCTIDNMLEAKKKGEDYSCRSLLKLKNNERGVIIYYLIHAFEINRLVAWEKKTLIDILPKEMLKRDDIRIMFFSIKENGKYCLSWDYFSTPKWSTCEENTICEVVNDFIIGNFKTLN